MTPSHPVSGSPPGGSSGGSSGPTGKPSKQFAPPKRKEDGEGKGQKTKHGEQKAKHSDKTSPLQPRSPLQPKKKQYEAKETSQQLAQMGPAGGMLQPKLDAGSAGTQATSGTSGTNPIDQIVKTVQEAMGASAIQVKVHETAGETHIGVQLSNGVHVEIALSPGQKDMNITITGLTASQQAVAEETQGQLREKLAEQGMTVHQITTMRSETGAPAPMAPTQPQPLQSQPTEAQQQQQTSDEREGGGGDRDQPDEEEQQQ